MRMKTRLTTLVGKTIHLKAGDENAKSYSKYAKECQEYLRFGDDIDLASSGGLDRFSYLKICDTPQVLLTEANAVHAESFARSIETKIEKSSSSPWLFDFRNQALA